MWERLRALILIVIGRFRRRSINTDTTAAPIDTIPETTTNDEPPPANRATRRKIEHERRKYERERKKHDKFVTPGGATPMLIPQSPALPKSRKKSDEIIIE